MAYTPKADGPWVDKTAVGGTVTSNLIDAGDCNRWESNQLDAANRLTALEGGGTAPGAPTIGAATAGDGRASVAFTPPTSTGGNAITGYTATSTPGGITGSGLTSPITVTGLTNGTSYTFKVKATNSVGTGPESAASNAVVPTAAAPTVQPEKMAFYYGDPAQVNGSGGNTTTAADTFNDYDLVVFGEGIEQDTHAMHANTQTIIGLIKPTRAFGYIDLCSKNPQSSLYRCSNFSIAELQSRVDKWKAMGADGIFWDQAGVDYMVSRDRLNAAIDYTHSKGMTAFINIWNLPEGFEPGALPSPYANPLPDGTPNTLPDGNPNRLPTSMGPADYCLLESFAVVLSDWAENYSADPVATSRRGGQMVTYHNAYGSKGATVNTVGYNNPPFEQNKLDYVWWLTTVYGINAMAWGETWVYSSDTNGMPFRTRPNPGNMGQPILPLAVTTNGSQLRRTTTTGTIIVDTAAHTGAFYLAGTEPQPPAPPTQTVIDNFNDNVFNTSFWVRNDATQVTETGGRLRVALLTTAGYFGVNTAATVNFAGKWYGAKLVTAGDQTHASQQIYPFRIDIDSTHSAYWYLNQNLLWCYTNVGGSFVQRGVSFTYVPTTHVYLAVGELSGNIVWRYSTDGTTWTTHTSVANPFGTTTGTVVMQAGVAASETTTANVEWDDYSSWA